MLREKFATLFCEAKWEIEKLHVIHVGVGRRLFSQVGGYGIQDLK